jgi:hypothetical protein
VRDDRIGAVFADPDFEPDVMNGRFTIGRCAGMVARVRRKQPRAGPPRRKVLQPVESCPDGITTTPDRARHAQARRAPHAGTLDPMIP